MCDSRFAKKFKVKRFDQVMIMSGKYKGMTGQVQSVDRDNDRVYVTGVNLVKRHKKNEKPQEKSGFNSCVQCFTFC